MSRLGDIKARLAQLLRDDPVCMGAVSGATVTLIAREWAAQPVPLSGDALAERAGALGEMQRIEARFSALIGDLGEIDSGGFRLEMIRLAQAIHSVEAGLHVAGEQEDM